MYSSDDIEQVLDESAVVPEDNDGVTQADLIAVSKLSLVNALAVDPGPVAALRVTQKVAFRAEGDLSVEAGDGGVHHLEIAVTVTTQDERLVFDLGPLAAITGAFNQEVGVIALYGRSRLLQIRRTDGTKDGPDVGFHRALA